MFVFLSNGFIVGWVGPNAFFLLDCELIWDTPLVFIWKKNFGWSLVPAVVWPHNASSATRPQSDRKQLLPTCTASSAVCALQRPDVHICPARGKTSVLIHNTTTSLYVSTCEPHLMNFSVYAKLSCIFLLQVYISNIMTLSISISMKCWVLILIYY